MKTAASHLNDGGYAALLVSWLGHDEAKPDARPLAWVEDTDCDAWILPIWGGDPLNHAATWNDHLAGETEQYEAALEDWTSYLDDLGVTWVSEGGVILHKRVEAEHSTRIDQVDEDDLEDSGDQILRASSRARFSASTSRGPASRRQHRSRRPRSGSSSNSSRKAPGRSSSARTQPSTRGRIRSSR